MNLIGCTLFPELIKFRVTCRIHVVIGVIDMAVIDAFGVINTYFGNRRSLGNGIIRGSRRYQRYWGNELYFSGVMNFISVGK